MTIIGDISVTPYRMLHFNQNTGPIAYKFSLSKSFKSNIHRTGIQWDQCETLSH